MNDVIFEAVITTLNDQGVAHIAPFGVRYDGDSVVLMPFAPSTTLNQVRASGHAVLNICTDTRVFAGAVSARWRGARPSDAPELALCPTEHIVGARLACALSHTELALAHDDGDPQRPRLRLRRLHERQHAPFAGFNRAQAAVLEGAVLVSRLHLLAAEKIDAEMAYLRIAIDKTASATEREAWGWLQEAVALQRAQIAPP